MTMEKLLAGIHLFQDLSPTHLQCLAEGCKKLSFSRGSVIFHKGQAAEGFYYILRGQVKLGLLGPGGNEKVVEILGENMTFGEAVLFINQPFPVHAQTMRDTELLYIPRAPLMSILHRDSEFALKMLAGLSRRLHTLIQDQESNCLHNATQRVVGFFLSKQPPSRDQKHHAFSFTLPAAKAVVASLLNLSPETFSRILQNLREQNLIHLQGRTIYVPNPDKLREIGKC